MENKNRGIGCFGVLFIIVGVFIFLTIILVSFNTAREEVEMTKDDQGISQTENQKVVEIKEDDKSTVDGSRYIYHIEVAGIMDYITEATEVISLLVSLPHSYWGSEQVEMIDYQVIKIIATYKLALELKPPKNNKNHHELFVAAIKKYNEAIFLVRDSIALKNTEKMIESAGLLEEAMEMLNNAQKILK